MNDDVKAAVELMRENARSKCQCLDCDAQRAVLPWFDGEQARQAAAVAAAQVEAARAECEARKCAPSCKDSACYDSECHAARRILAAMDGAKP